MRLKRWESPRKEGRNDKGRGGSARQRQLKKQRQMLRKRLQEDSKAENSNQNKKQNKNNKQGGENISSPYFLSFSLYPNFQNLHPQEFPQQKYPQIASQLLPYYPNSPHFHHDAECSYVQPFPLPQNLIQREE
jgi:hypothetical protein